MLLRMHLCPLHQIPMLLFIKLFKKPLLVSLPPPYGRLNILPEVKTSAPSMWHIGPQQGFSRAAFPP
jgi:hypothetical protein